MKKYGEIISKLRKQHGLTQEQLGKKLNVSYQAVSKWENNLSEPDLETIEKIAEVFGISMSDFFDITKDNNNKVNNTTTHKETNINNDKNFIKTKPWYLVAGLGVLIVVLSLFAFLIPVKYPSSKIYEMVDPSVFCITAEGSGIKQAGTGFFINDKGLAVTNYHVIENCTSGKVQLSNGKTYNISKIVGCDEDKDIAIIQIDIKKSKPVKIGNSNKISVGDVVYAIGYPESFVLGNADSTLTQGIISKTSYTIDGNAYIQTTADMTHGNSGGVLINEQGKVIGITSGQISDGNIDYMNLAIPINKIKNIKQNINVSLEEYYKMHKTFYYYSDGKIMFKQDFVSGNKLPNKTPNQKTGYTFDAWYTDTTYSTKFYFSAPVYDMIACYAKWIPNTYTIKFDSNGGSGTMIDVVATYDKELILPANTFELLHYDFKGWKIKGTNTTFTNNQKVNNLTSANNTEVILEAIWGKIKYTIQFDTKIIVKTINDLVLEYEQIGEVPYINYQKTGYIFKNWSHNNIEYYEGDQISNICEISETIIFEAVWEPITYTVRFVYESQEPYEQTITFGQKQTLLKNVFEKQNYHFVHWKDEESGYTYSDNSTLYTDMTSTNNDIIVLTAIFEENYYYVRFNKTDVADEDSYYYYKLDFSQSTKIPMVRKVGYFIDYWIDEENNKYYPDDNIEKLSSIHEEIIDLYPVWKEETIIVVYSNMHTSERTEPFEVLYTQEFELLENPFDEIDGYQFSHYQINISNCYPGDVISISQVFSGQVFSATIYAVFIPKQYTIKFDGNNATSGNMDDIIATFDSSVTITENQFEKEGYFFIGWKYNDTIYFDLDLGNLISTYQEEVVLTAVWQNHLTGEGTEEKPYQITTIEDYNKFALLSRVRNYQDEHVELTKDIDFNSTEIFNIKEFNGSFNGNNFKLSNFKITNSDLNDALFNVNNGVVKNLSIENADIIANGDCGLLVGINNGEILDCNATGKLIAFSEETFTIGGLVSTNYGTINRCVATINMAVESLYYAWIGGFVGTNYGEIENCYVKPTITASLVDTTIGGFASISTGSFGGENIALISYCYSINNITVLPNNSDSIFIGGFIGRFNFSTNIENCFVKNNITMTYDTEIETCKIDNFCSYSMTSNISAYLNNNYVSDISTYNIKINNEDVQLYTSASIVSDNNLKNEEWMNYNLFNTFNSWEYNGDYPTLSTQDKTTITINTLEDFLVLNRRNLNVDVDLNCDIDLSGIDFIILENQGTFNGNGHTISNLKILNLSEEAGLFAINKGNISNLKLTNTIASITSEKTMVVGGIAGRNEGNIINCCVYGIMSINSTGGSYVGGVVGINYGLIKNSYANASINTTAQVVFAGGISGDGNGNIENCYSEGNLIVVSTYNGNAHCYAGGISGSSSQSESLNYCFSLMNIKVTSSASYTELYSIGYGNKSNCCGCIEQELIKNGLTINPQNPKNKQELTNKYVLLELNFKEFTTQENLIEDTDCVWIFNAEELPKLWFEV